MTAATEIVGDDGAVTTSTVGACFELDSGSTGLAVGFSASTSGTTGNSGSAGVLVDVGAVDAVSSGVLVCAPPLLLTVTPVPTWVLDDVAPDADELLVVDVAVAVDVDPELVAVEPLSVNVDVEVEVPVPASAADEPDSVLEAELSCADDDALDADPSVSALATPGEATTITPIPNAAANAPTRPMYRL